MSESTSEEASSGLRQAAELIERARHAEAIPVISGVIADAPRHGRAWALMAHAQLGQGRDEGALAAARTAASLAPDDDRPHLVACTALRRLGRHDEAVLAGCEAVRRAPDSWATHYSLSQALLSARHLREARVEANRAVELGPRQAQAHAAVGAVAAASGRTREATGALQRALALDPRNAAVRHALSSLRGRSQSAGSLTDAANQFATIGGADSQHHRGIDVTIGRFMSILAYLVWVDAYLLVRMSAQPDSALALLILVAPPVYGVRFVLRLPRSLRHYLGEVLLSQPALKLAGTLEAAAIAVLIPAAIGPPGPRLGLALLAAVAALAARILVYIGLHRAAKTAGRQFHLGVRRLIVVAVMLTSVLTIALRAAVGAHGG